MEKNRVKKIGVLGAESTGKTWLCEALAKHFNTAWVPEYAREYFNDSDIYNYTLADLIIIAKKQIELEEQALKNAQRFLFCDTTLITLKIWAELEFGNAPALIEQQLARVRYDFYMITSNEIEWVADKLRENKHSRELLFEMNKTEVKRTGTPYAVITGSEKERLKNAVTIIYGL